MSWDEVKEEVGDPSKWDDVVYDDDAAGEEEENDSTVFDYDGDQDEQHYLCGPETGRPGERRDLLGSYIAAL